MIGYSTVYAGMVDALVYVMYQYWSVLMSIVSLNRFTHTNHIRIKIHSFRIYVFSVMAFPSVIYLLAALCLCVAVADYYDDYIDTPSDQFGK